MLSVRPPMTSRILTAAFCFAALCAPAAAQSDFPAAPVRIIVPFAAGGPTDVVTRILGDLLSARWGGKPVVIENRPGAGTIVATEAIAKGTPDGTTVGMATNAFLINPAIEHSLPYDTEKDFAGVSMVATQPVALVANKNFPANTIAELVDYVKKSAEPLNYTSPGPRGVGISPARCWNSAPASKWCTSTITAARRRSPMLSGAACRSCSTSGIRRSLTSKAAI
jgi:tripartite-type tricarboxylate transporter receptor subunit TctC